MIFIKNSRVHVPSVLTPIKRLSITAELNNDDSIQSILYNTIDVNHINNTVNDKNNDKKKKNIGICSASRNERGIYIKIYTFIYKYISIYIYLNICVYI
jgi:hypothetical protein